MPIIVVNQGFGFSCEIGGCRVTDLKFLRLFLSSGEFVVDAAVSTRGPGFATSSTKIYGSQAEAAAKFEDMLGDPPPLRRFLNRLKSAELIFPTSAGTTMAVTRFVLGEYGPDNVTEPKSSPLR
jgi:hypothetical protein